MLSGGKNVICILLNSPESISMEFQAFLRSIPNLNDNDHMLLVELSRIFSNIWKWKWPQWPNKFFCKFDFHLHFTRFLSLQSQFCGFLVSQFEGTFHPASFVHGSLGSGYLLANLHHQLIPYWASFHFCLRQCTSSTWKQLEICRTSLPTLNLVSNYSLI